eukprot:Tbor_TRINITY_DN4990_c0_g1::TRINITY_DN4990_c0_g1_i1::g.9679::m.9679
MLRSTLSRFQSLSSHNVTSPLTDGQRQSLASFGKLADKIHRSYRIDQLLSICGPTDVILARQEKSKGRVNPMIHSINNRNRSVNTSNDLTYSYMGLKDTSVKEVAQCLLLLPDHLRHFHTLCARDETPLDFYADIDLPDHNTEEAEEVILQITDRLFAKLQALKFGNFHTVLLESPNRQQKKSFHLHIRGEDSCFVDFQAPRAIAMDINRQLRKDALDLGCYRRHGTLRCAFSSKMDEGEFTNDTSDNTIPKHLSAASDIMDNVRYSHNYSNNYFTNHLVPYRAKDPELQGRLRTMFDLSPEQIMEVSLVIRQQPNMNVKKKLRDKIMPLRLFSAIGGVNVIGNSRASSPTLQEVSTPDTILATTSARKKEDEYRDLFPMNEDGTPMYTDNRGNCVSKFMREDMKWIRYKIAISFLQRIPSFAAESYDIWVRVGLALHNFGPDDHIYRQWIRFSMQAPSKYCKDICDSKWQHFGSSEHSSDLGNWRRGYFYLTRKVWRELGIDSGIRDLEE